jgi:aminoglycoside phosphotransferase (APT) family kinase protein
MNMEIMRCLSQCFGEGIRVEKMVRNSNSRQHLYEVTVETPEGSRNVFFRKNTFGLTWWKREDPDKAEREAAALMHLRNSSIPVPQYYGHGPYWTCVSKMEGIRLRDRTDLYESKQATEETAWVVARLHSLPIPEGPFPHVTSETVIETLKEWAEYVGDARLQAAVCRLRPLDDGETLFLHGDLNPGNILFDQQMRVSGLIDWEDSVIGDFRFDVVTVYWFMLRGAPKMAGHFLQSYAQMSGRRIEHLDQWLALLTLRSWALAEVMRKQGETFRLFETEEEKQAAEQRLRNAGF